MRGILAARGIRLLEKSSTTAIERGVVHLESGERLEADDVFVVTEASASPWFAETGLALDGRGFFAVDDTLRTTDDENIFAVGDAPPCRPIPGPRPACSRSARARRWRATCGARCWARHPSRSRRNAAISRSSAPATAARGDPRRLVGRRPWVWRWKDYIDRKWMRMYREPPAELMDMDARAAPPDPALADVEARRLLADIGMRCGGCGAKVGAGVLTRVLARLGPSPGSSVTIGLDAPDDAAMIEVPAGKALVQSVDFFRTFIDDPFVFGEVAAVHALGDVWAMGAKPHSALALAVVPDAAERLMEEDLFQMLSGARRILDHAGSALIGGHSGEGPEAALGFSVNGLVDPASRAPQGRPEAGRQAGAHQAARHRCDLCRRHARGGPAAPGSPQRSPRCASPRQPPPRPWSRSAPMPAPTSPASASPAISPK